MPKLMYRLVSMAASIGGGILATTIFRRIWKLAGGGDEAPRATDTDKGWPEILTAAALQGALFAVVTASLERLAAAGTRSLTGTWPGEDDGEKEKKA